MTRASALGALATVALLAGCGGGNTGTGAPGGQPAAGSDTTFEHVHGLGINPRDGSLLIATHTGLFRAPPASSKARLVGTSRQDLMGFTVVGPDRFLASGHPAPGQSAPSNIGLIRSETGGRVWAPVSLSGEADFHVLRAAGTRVYGFDSGNGRLLVSGDGGRSWKQHATPGPLIDLAIRPEDSSRIVASTDRAIIASPDAGRTWRVMRPNLIGLLAWQGPKTLLLIDGNGRARRSGDGGRSWTMRGSIGGQPAALTTHGAEVYAAVAGGAILRSRDGGASWSVRAQP